MRLRRSAVVLAVAGAALTLVGAAQPYSRFSDDDWLSIDTSYDVQVVAPSIVLVMTVLLLGKPHVAAEWLVGAAAALVALDYFQTTALTLNQEFGWLSAGLRTGGAALAVVALVLAWPAAQQRGTPISAGPAIVLLAGCGLAMVGTWRYGTQYSTELWSISVSATAGLLLLLVARAFLLRARTTAAAALTAAGLSGVVVWGIEAWLLIDRRAPATPASLSRQSGSA